MRQLLARLPTLVKGVGRVLVASRTSPAAVPSPLLATASATLQDRKKCQASSFLGGAAAVWIGLGGVAIASASGATEEEQESNEYGCLLPPDLLACPCALCTP